MPTHKPWQCKCCGHCNSYLRAQCTACFNGNNIPCSDSCTCVVMNPRCRDLLAYGYCRRHSRHQKIPDELLQLCYQYYGDVMTWKLSGTVLSDFYSSSRERLILGPQFSIHDIRTQMMIMLKTFKQRLHVVFGFMIDSEWFTTNKDIKSITMHYRLSLDEIGYEFKDTKRLTREDSKTMWYYPQISLKELAAMKWDNLHFSCFAEILDMVKLTKCCKPRDIEYFGENVRLNLQHEYRWNLSDAELQHLKGCKFDQSVYSPSFNYNSFCVSLSPNGISTAEDPSEGMCAGKIKLLRLPRGIGAMEMKFSMDVKCDETAMLGFNGSGIFHYRGMKDFCLHKKSDAKSLQGASTIEVVVTLNIVEMFDREMVKVPKSAWHEIGL